MRTPCKFTLICEWMQQQNASLALLRLILTPLLLLLRWVRPLCCTNKFSDDSHGINTIAMDRMKRHTRKKYQAEFLNAIIFTWEAIQWSEYLFVFVFFFHELSRCCYFISSFSNVILIVGYCFVFYTDSWCCCFCFCFQFACWATKNCKHCCYCRWIGVWCD